MKLNLRTHAEKIQSTGVVLFAAEGKSKEDILPASVSKTAAQFELASFKGKIGETVYIPLKGQAHLIIAGIGRTPSKDAIRSAAAGAVRCALAHEMKDLTIFPPSDPGLDADSSLRCAAEGIVLGNYSFDRYKTKKKKLVAEAHFVSPLTSAAAILRETGIICGNTLMCRDLVNGTSEEVTPESIAALAKKIAKTSRIRCEIIKGGKIGKLGMGLFEAVARGSIHEPHLVILSYKGNPGSKETTALVGKGITFDSGGYNLKPTGHMEDMRCDMAGAAAVLFAIDAIAKLGLKKNVTAYLAVCENMIGSRAYKPGDVFTAFDGTTVEILSTDAEGRLVLSDTIAYAIRTHRPSSIIEASTLTGACVTTFGDIYAGLLTKDAQLRSDIENAAQSTGEKVWALPLDEEYAKDIESEIADLRNINPERKAGTIAGGMFLSHFAKETPFAHLDIAGTAWISKDRGVNPKNATGFGVRLLTEVISGNRSVND
jgi:leucyl aminopeptidase